MPKIDIFTFTYNRPELLARTINSIISQSFTDWEYFIFNDGSHGNETDDCIEKFMKKDSRIHIYKSKHNMLTETEQFLSAHNDIEALKMIEKYQHSDTDGRAKYMLSLDDDDYLRQDALEILYNLAVTTESDIVGSASKWVFPDGSMRDKLAFSGVHTFDRIGAMRELLKREKLNSGEGGRLYRKSVRCAEKLLNDVQPQGAFRTYRDIFRTYRVFNEARRVTVTGEPLVYFSRHDTNMSGLDTKEQIANRLEEHLYANHVRTEWLGEKMPELADFCFYCELSFMISLYQRVYKLEIEQCYKTAEKMKEFLMGNKSFLENCLDLKESERNFLHTAHIL